MSEKLSNSEFRKTNTNFCEGSQLEVFEKVWLKKEKKLWKEIHFAICTPIGSYVNEKEKKIVKIQDFKNFEKKNQKKPGDTVDSYLSPKSDVYSLNSF